MKCNPGKLTLALLYHFSLSPVLAADLHQTATEVETLDEVKVHASADANAKGLMKPYTGAQVAKGGRVGVLGHKDVIDTLFSINAYTGTLIQNQQARSVGNVLLNDPWVPVARGFGHFQQSCFIRGVILNSDSVAYNGLYGILPPQYIAAGLFERVEVSTGASTFLDGTSPGGDAMAGLVMVILSWVPHGQSLSVPSSIFNDEVM